MLFKMDIQSKLYVTQNIWQGLSHDTSKKVTLMFNKPEYIGICSLESSEVLMNYVNSLRIN